jgi:hypothetical protein
MQKRNEALEAIAKKTNQIGGAQLKLFASLTANQFDPDALDAEIQKLQTKHMNPAVRRSAVAYLEALETPYSLYWAWLQLPSDRKKTALDRLNMRCLVAKADGSWEWGIGKPRKSSNPAAVILRSSIAYPDTTAGNQMVSRDAAAFSYLIKEEVLPAKFIAHGKKKGEGLEAWCRLARGKPGKKAATVIATPSKTPSGPPPKPPNQSKPGLKWSRKKGLTIEPKASVAILKRDGDRVVVLAAKPLPTKKLAPVDFKKFLAVAVKKLSTVTE